ncbi:formate dehydrogenase accessory sulfurtransferase FdhD [Thiothrix subterranea]|uniref:Sulfur carrier protein FdhD n=1 Tax=Thiothrix subterranea TaxID=2735563 RepID=A0AA51R5J0_9GAMM|nr:formate dehydrogenase accessory sulfurtransferase FdhD [Thiothrix subterranea]MDQ5770716.1 formate dehydrogenase accessory sulfurtransferase FdhD [Thiothrix subterranea]WML87726.1 formate dehydrogenase accessory sulfurtransferase FdhD [Thiothrix subterranea]
MTNHPSLFLSAATRETTVSVTALDEYGQARDGYISAEHPLTIYLDKREILTLMTMGSQPELLVLGWLRNQNLISDIRHIKAIQVDWETESVAVTTHQGIAGLDEKLSRKTVTTGCGQGTVFGNLLEKFDQLRLPTVTLRQSLLYATLQTLSAHNEIYRRAGAVHGCALCAGTQILSFVEDVGRHNAVDTIAGHMWLNAIDGPDKLFYTTGRLTSEMVIKVAQMGIPILLSRSGVTQMGLEMARKVGVLLIARAKGQHFQVYHGAERLLLDAIPAPRPPKDVP